MENDVYQTRDLAEAALLYSYQLKLLKLVKEGERFWFVFHNRKKAEELSAKFWQKEIEVNAKIYAEALRSLKDRIFARKDRL